MTAPSSASDGCVSSASWTCGSNCAVGLDLDEPLALRARRELRGATRRTPSSSFASSCSRRRLERPLEVVEHGQELLDEPLVGARDEALLVARGPLAVVVEVGGEALQVGRGTRRARPRARRAARSATRSGLAWAVDAARSVISVFASSSMTSYSASSTTSSSASPPPSPARGGRACSAAPARRPPGRACARPPSSASVFARISPTSSPSSASLQLHRSGLDRRGRRPRRATSRCSLSVFSVG